MTKTNEKSATVEPVVSGSLVDEIAQSSRLNPADETYSMTKQGLQLFLDELLKPERKGIKITTAIIDDMIGELDKKISKQLDTVLHDRKFQEVESAWRSLKYLVDKTNFRENNRIEILNVSKDALLADFEDAPEIVKSGLYKMAYSQEFGQFGGQPYGMIVGNYEFSYGSQDMKLLQNIAAVSTLSHAPFIAAANAQMFSVDSFAGLPALKDLKSMFESPLYAKWKGFRQSEDSRSVGLTLPHFMLRVPYGPETVPARSFNYVEDVSGGDQSFLWGNAAFALASCITDSFAKYRWCANIIGPQGGGAVSDLPVYNYKAMGEIRSKIPTEIEISDRREFELAEEGFIALTMRKGSDNAAFFSANSTQKPKFFGTSKEGKEAELNYKLGTQLPYMFVISRLAHYLKVIQRENIGTWKERNDLERELNTWIMQYVADQENPVPGVRSRRPLRKAEVMVEDVAGEPGWYRCSIKVRPHFKYMGASFTLSLVGKLDKQ
jgi:type VI secretion system protein ImpC